MLYRSPDILPPSFSKPSIFVAGGISDCPDWQEDIVSIIDLSKYDVINPRRVGGFDRTGATAEAQITWEAYALDRVSTYLFWFPKETLCPITLFELGKVLEMAKQASISIIVGWHENYAREFDLRVQLRLTNLPTNKLVYNEAGWDKFTSIIKAKFA